MPSPFCGPGGESGGMPRDLADALRRLAEALEKTRGGGESDAEHFGTAEDRQREESKTRIISLLEGFIPEFRRLTQNLEPISRYFRPLASSVTGSGLPPGLFHGYTHARAMLGHLRHGRVVRATNSARLAARAFGRAGGSPKREASRWFTNKKLDTARLAMEAYAGRSGAARAPAYAAARSEVMAFSRSGAAAVAARGGTAAVGSAAGGGAGAAAAGGGALALATGPVGIAAAALAATAIAAGYVTYKLYQLGPAVHEATTKILESNRRFAEFSPSMAAVFAERDMMETLRNIERGERQSGSARYLMGAEQRIARGTMEVDILKANVGNIIAGVKADITTVLYMPFNALASRINSWMDNNRIPERLEEAINYFLGEPGAGQMSPIDWINQIAEEENAKHAENMKRLDAMEDL